jgi:hypothetical protein
MKPIATHPRRLPNAQPEATSASLCSPERRSLTPLRKSQQKSSSALHPPSNTAPINIVSTILDFFIDLSSVNKPIMQLGEVQNRKARD